MAVRPWNSAIGSTPRARKIRIVARETAKTLICLALAYLAILGAQVIAMASRDERFKAEANKALEGDAGLSSLVAAVILIGGACLALFVLRSQGRRQDSAIEAIVEYRVAREREDIERETARAIVAVREDNDRWKNEQIAEIYQMILDQQARGLLPCPKCRQQHDGGHRKTA